MNIFFSFCVLLATSTLLALPANSSVNFTTMRHVFVRGEAARFDLSAELSPDAQIKMEVAGITGSLTPGGKTNVSWTLDTNLLKAGDYTVNAAARAGDRTLATNSFAFTIAPPRNPQRFPVWCWGWGKFAAPYGFNGGFSFGTAEPLASNPKKLEARGMLLDEATRQGLDMGVYLRPLRSTTLTDQKQLLGRSLKGGISSRPTVEPARPEVLEHCRKVGASVATVADWPAVTHVMLNSEFQLSVSHTSFTRARLKKALGFNMADFAAGTKAPPEAFPKDGIVEDNNKYRQFYLWWWNEGLGVPEANLAAAREIKRFLPRTTVWFEPFRLAPVLGTARGLDMLATWSYTFPDPKYIGYVEMLRAGADPGQKIQQDISLFEYAGWLAPKDKGHCNMPGDIARLCTWIALAHRPDCLAYYHAGSWAKLMPKGDGFNVVIDPFEGIGDVSHQFIVPFGPYLRELKVPPRKVALLNAFTPLIFTTHVKRAGYACEAVRDWSSLLQMAHVEHDYLLEETLLAQPLDRYDTIVAPYCEVLPRTAVEKLRAFVKRGGTLVADKFLGPDIPGALKLDFDFSYRRRMSVDKVSQAKLAQTEQVDAGAGDVSADQDREIMNGYAKKLCAALDKHLTRYADADSPEALVSTLDGGNARVVFILNDHRGYGPRFGQWKRIHEKGLPLTTTVRLRDTRPGARVFDLLTQKPLVFRREGERLVVSLDLPPAGARVLAITDNPPAGVAISMPASVPRGKPVTLTVKVTGARGQQPLQITITDSAGRTNEFSRWAATTDGAYQLTWAPALNEPAGEWRVRVQENITGQSAESRLAVQ